MPSMQQEIIVFVFNSPLSSGCDYVMQTMRIVARKQPAYGIALGDVISWPRWLMGSDRWVIRRFHGATIIRPIGLLPGMRFRFVRTLTYVVAAVILRVYLALRHGRTRKFLWFFEPFHLPSILPVFSGYVTIYDCVDYFPGFHEQARHEHDALLRLATHVFANSDILAKKLQKQRPDVGRVPLGFAMELFDGKAIRPVLPRKTPFVVGYIGSISDRIDFPLLLDTISKLPDVQFVFVGPVERNVFGKTDRTTDNLNKMLAYPHVTWVPNVAKDRIPSVLARIDVGLVPYRDDLVFNRYSFPMKILEYFAAGRPVVAGDIAALRPFAEKGLLTIARGSTEYVRAIRQYQFGGWPKRLQRTQQAAARSQSWSKKVHAILTNVL